MAKAKAKTKAQPKASPKVKKPAGKTAKAVAKKPAAKKPAKSGTQKTRATKPAAKKPAAPAKKINSNPTKPVSKVMTKTTTKASAKTSSPAKPAAPKKRVKLAEGYKPSDKEEYMNPSQIEYFRQKLLAWKADLSGELHETLNNLKEENWQEPDITDRATVEIDTGLELRTRDRYRKLINKIDSALNRIDRGEYGYCEETGEEIGIKRLEARPIATLSIEAQERHERDERTHYDEDMEDRA